MPNPECRGGERKKDREREIQQGIRENRPERFLDFRKIGQHEHLDRLSTAGFYVAAFDVRYRIVSRERVGGEGEGITTAFFILVRDRLGTLGREFTRDNPAEAQEHDHIFMGAILSKTYGTLNRQLHDKIRYAWH